MQLFRRAWQVSVGTLGLGALDIRFRVKRSLRWYPSTAEITAINLTREHRQEVAHARYAPVVLEAGYVSGRAVLFRGTVRRIVTTREGGDWLTTITCGDGEHTVQTSRTRRSYARDTQVPTVIQDLARDLGVGIGNAVQMFTAARLGRVGTAFPSGTVLSGSAARELDLLARSCGLEWSIQDGNLQVLRRGEPLNRTAVRLTPSSGLLDTPVAGQVWAINAVVHAKALLIPDLLPGRLVVLDQTQGATGTYRIQTVTYVGESAGVDWHAELELWRRRE